MAVEDLSSLPIYGSLDSLETDILGSMSSITSMAPMAASKESLQYLAPLRNAANEGAMNGNGNYDRGNYDMSPFNTYMATDEVL